MDSSHATGTHRQDEGLRERIATLQPVNTGAVDEAHMSAGNDAAIANTDGKAKKTFGRTPDGTSK
jgi:hypothetical protein